MLKKVYFRDTPFNRWHTHTTFHLLVNFRVLSNSFLPFKLFCRICLNWDRTRISFNINPRNSQHFAQHHSTFSGDIACLPLFSMIPNLDRWSYHAHHPPFIKVTSTLDTFKVMWNYPHIFVFMLKLIRSDLAHWKTQINLLFQNKTYQLAITQTEVT